MSDVAFSICFDYDEKKENNVIAKIKEFEIKQLYLILYDLDTKEVILQRSLELSMAIVINRMPGIGAR